MGILQTIADGAGDWWNNPLTQISMGLFATNSGNYGNPNIGQGVMTGMNNYASLQEQARKRAEEERLRQREQTLWDQQQSDRAAMMKATGGVPLDVYKFKNPQLDPDEISFDQWMKMTPAEQSAYIAFRNTRSTGSNDTSNIRDLNHLIALEKKYPPTKDDQGNTIDHPYVRIFKEQLARSQWFNAGTAHVNSANGQSIKIDHAGKKIDEAEGAAIAERLLAFPQAMQAAASYRSAAVDQLDDVNRLLGITEPGTTGFNSYLSSIPMTDANAWMNLRDTIVSNIAMEKMAQLKELSATGSTGFGALSEKELKLLMDFRGSLEQSQRPEDIKRILERYADHLEGAKSRYERAMQQEVEWYEKNKGNFRKDNQVDTSAYKNDKPRSVSDIRNDPRYK